MAVNSSEHAASTCPGHSVERRYLQMHGVAFSFTANTRYQTLSLSTAQEKKREEGWALQ